MSRREEPYEGAVCKVNPGGSVVAYTSYVCARVCDMPAPHSLVHENCWSLETNPSHPRLRVVHAVVVYITMH